MNKAFIKKLEEILEEKIIENKDFKKYKNWDSLSILSIIISIQDDYKITISNEEIIKSKNAKGLWKTIDRKK